MLMLFEQANEIAHHKDVIVGLIKNQSTLHANTAARQKSAQ